MRFFFLKIENDFDAIDDLEQVYSTSYSTESYSCVYFLLRNTSPLKINTFGQCPAFVPDFSSFDPIRIVPFSDSTNYDSKWLRNTFVCMVIFADEQPSL